MIFLEFSSHLCHRDCFATWTIVDLDVSVISELALVLHWLL